MSLTTTTTTMSLPVTPTKTTPTSTPPNTPIPAERQRRRSSRSASVPTVLTVRDDADTDDDCLINNNSSLLHGDFKMALLDTGRHSRVSIAPMSHTFRPSPSPSGAPSQRSVCLVEVAPVDFRDTKSRSTWKLPLSEFSKRKSSQGAGDGTKTLSKRIRKYYKAQDKLIEEFESLEDKEDGNDGCPTQDTLIRTAKRLSQISFAANFVLLVIKAVAVSLSGSISVISSLVDSAVDLLSGVVIWWTSRAVRRPDPYIYPSGRRRLEPLAIVVLSVIMSLASFQLIIQSMQKIITFTSDKSSVPHFTVETIAITSLTIAMKVALFLMCYITGRRQGGLTDSMQVLMQDHRNDVMSNTVALVCGYLGSYEFAQEVGEENVAYIDPLGAVLIGAYILLSWWRTGLEQIRMLTGVSAKPEFLSKLTWICLNHHSLITEIDTVRAFHFGSRFLVEVDIVLPPDMTLQDTHQIGESLQQKLESLAEVERAFVHVDWETDHRPEVEHKIG